jgi:hypothetical protein
MQIGEKRMLLVKIRALIDKENIDEVENLLENANKKKI